MIHPFRFCVAALACGFALVGARAQVTESPHTIKPGKILFEIDGVRLSFGRADAAGNKVDAVAVASTLVSAGLTERVDLQAGVDLFLRERYEYRGTRDSRSGIGDVALRVKWTFWHDEKRGAAAIIPYIKLPSGTGGVGSDATTWGVIVPWEQSLGAGVTIGAMAQWDVVRNDAGNGYDSIWTGSAVARRDFTDWLGVYGEAQFAAASTGFDHWEGNVGVGVLWKPSKRLELDYEILRGLNSRASAWTHVWRVNWEW